MRALPLKKQTNKQKTRWKTDSSTFQKHDPSCGELCLRDRPEIAPPLSANFGSLSTGKLVAMDSKKNNATDSQVWHTDTDPNSSTGRPVARSKKITVVPSLFPRNLARVYGESSHTYDRNLVVQWKTKWSRSTSTQ